MPAGFHFCLLVDGDHIFLLQRVWQDHHQHLFYTGWTQVHQITLHHVE